MNAVIYCRVSSRDQVEGTSLESQERACRDYAKKHDLNISRGFVEEGESAKFADRTQLLELLAYCRDKKQQIEVLLVWKIDRFARNVEDHYAIKAALRKLGVHILSVTEPIQADPNGKLLETILAGFAQFDNDVRAMRTIQGMQQRLREGIWPWKPPLGYIPPKTGKKREPDTPDLRCFDAIQKAWQFFATGAYSKADIVRLLHTWGVRAYRGRPVSPQLLDHMFRNPYYAGILRDPWSGEEFAGRHAPMVDEREFASVQQVIAARNNADSHHQLNEAFPLRGLVRCPSCNRLMTGYFAAGRRQRYPYYKCFWRGCPTRTRSYSATAVHDELLRFLAETSVPSYLAAALFSEVIVVLSEKTEQARKSVARHQQELRGLEEQRQELVSMRMARLVSNDEYVTQRERIMRRIFEIKARDEDATKMTLAPGDISGLTSTLAGLDAAWQTAPLSVRRSFGEMMFPAGYAFQGVRTAERGLLYRTIEDLMTSKSNVAALVRENLNTIMSEIRRLLAIIRQPKQADNEAA